MHRRILLLLYSAGRLAWIAMGAEPVEDARWAALADEVRRSLGIRRPVRLLQNRSVPFLGTWGIMAPRVLLPRDAESWPDERIRIPGFYDDVKEPSVRDRELMDALPDVANEYKTRYGVKKFIKGLAGGTDLKMEEVFVPTCTICGLTSGYQGSGSKTVLPARASAKVDFRLVPDQKPEDILKKLRAHLDAEGFEDVKITYLGGEAAARTDPDDSFVRTVVKAAEEVYEFPMELVPMVGGSGPSYPFVYDLGLPVATAGLGHPDTRAHAPNENMRVDLYLKHARHMARVIKEFSK